MSMNLAVSAYRNATVTIKGKQETVKMYGESFDFFQTPTNVTYELLDYANDSNILVEKYMEWVRTWLKPVEEDVYDYEKYDPLTNDCTHVGKKWVDAAAEHEAKLREWLQLCNDGEFIIEFYAQ